MKLYNIFRVIRELYQEQYLGDDKTTYLKFFISWVIDRKCPIIKHHNKDGTVLYIDTLEVCHICSGTGLDYNSIFKKSPQHLNQEVIP